MAVDLAGLEKRCADALATQSGDVAHDLAHVRRVVATARRLAVREKARMEIVVPAAWLHDCVTLAKDSPERAQASRLAAGVAVRWLREWNYPEITMPEVAHAIEAHSFSAGLVPRSLEAKVVQDADRLDAIGAVGLARCLMLSGALRRPLYAETDPFCRGREPDERRAAVDHFYTKLFKIQETMQTAGGRSEAIVRTEYLRGFIAELKKEIDA